MSLRVFSTSVWQRLSNVVGRNRDASKNGATCRISARRSTFARIFRRRTGETADIPAEFAALALRRVVSVPMTSILQWLENTSLSTTLRDSPNVFLYPTILAFHTLGLAFFVGLSSAIALRVLGAAPGLPLAPFRKFYPVMWLGFAVNAVSGTLLLVIEPTKFLTMVDFYVKLIAIAGAVFANRLLYLRHFKNPAPIDPNPLPRRDRALAVAILFFWAGAITAGRLTAYDDPHAQWQTALGTAIVTAALLAGGYVSVAVWRAIRPAVAPTATTIGGPEGPAAQMARR
jgi:hypothetical protein